MNSSVPSASHQEYVSSGAGRTGFTRIDARGKNFFHYNSKRETFLSLQVGLELHYLKSLFRFTMEVGVMRQGKSITHFTR